MISHSVVGVDLPRILAEHQERAAAFTRQFCSIIALPHPRRLPCLCTRLHALATLFAALLLTACTAPQGLAGKAAQQQNAPINWPMNT